MKRLYASLLFALLFNALHAQIVDTVLFENFQAEEDPVPNWPLFPSGNDTTWVNCDADGLTPFDGDPVSYQWFSSEFFYNALDSVSGITNYCIASLSYMEGFEPGNRNWLIMPPIEVTDNSYTLHWKSAPFQLPRYIDGYSVLVSTDGNDLFDGSNPFTDQLFRAASMEAITGEGESIDISNFDFTEGYLHADSLRDQEYLVLWAPGDSTLMRGLLEPHSVSLAAYAGQTIYIAFLHDSDDDYYLALDDFLVTRAQASGVSDLEASLRFRTYPNPVATNLNVMYRLASSGPVTLRLSDLNGRTVWEQSRQQAAGEQMIDLPMTKLPAGAYTVTLATRDGMVSRVVTKM